MLATASRAWSRAGLLAVLLVVVFGGGPLASQPDSAGQQPPAAERSPDIVLFTHIACPICESAKTYLEDLQERKPGLIIQIRELTEDPRAATDLEQIGRSAGEPSPGVPAWVIGGRYFLVGFGGASSTGRQIEGMLANLGLLPATGPPGVAADPEDVTGEVAEGIERAATGSVTLPFFGELSAATTSLPVLTGLIAFVDGFNPCSLWVLTFLLGIVLYSGSRRRVLLVGGLFLLVTASVYGLFIVGMFGTLRYLAYMNWITLLVAAIAMVFAVVNIKDYFWFRKGVSFTISDQHKPKLYERIRNLIHPGRSVPALVVGTVVLALGITLVELPCTAGFPMVWSGIVASQAVPFSYFAALLGLYISIYLLIELVIFGSVVVTMKQSRFEERHGRILKLFGGMIMLALALTLILAPDTMHSLTGTLAVFGGAITASAMVLLIHRLVLPRYGIRIGTEKLGS